MTVQGPVKEQQPDGSSHGGGGLFTIEQPTTVGGTPGPPPPQDQSDHRGKQQHLPLGKTGRAIFGAHRFGSQTPPQPPHPPSVLMSAFGEGGEWSVPVPPAPGRPPAPPWSIPSQLGPVALIKQIGANNTRSNQACINLLNLMLSQCIAFYSAQDHFTQPSFLYSQMTMLKMRPSTAQVEADPDEHKPTIFQTCHLGVRCHPPRGPCSAPAPHPHPKEKQTASGF